MSDNLQSAISALQNELADLEKEAADMRNMINRLCARAGLAPIYADAETGSQQNISSIRADTFYGKSVITAAREYLDMRKAANLGPASPRDIYEALKKGGFAFSSKEEVNSIAVVRQAIGKQTTVFHRLPTGDYGLIKWYPKAKAAKSASADNPANAPDNESADSNEESADD